MNPAAPAGTLSENIGAGLLSSVIMLCYALSYAALIFSGDLAAYLHSGVLVTLMCCVVVAPVIALSSSIRFTIGGPDGNSAAILAGMASGIAADLAYTSGQGVLVTLLAALALSSLLSGVLLYLLGATKGSALIQFLPYPVMGGYLAGTGYLLLSGSFRVLTGERLQWSQLRHLLDLPWLAWLPALVVCGVLMAGARRIKRLTLVVPLGIGAGLLVFFAGLTFTGVTPQQARQAGLLFESVPLSALQLPVLLPPEQIHWRVIVAHLPEFFVVAAVSALTILLNATGAGLACRQDPDLDQEMRAAGVANLLSGALGGIVGYQSLSRTLLNHRAGGVSRISGLAAAAGCLIVVLAFPGLIGWMPKSVLVGLQLYLGIGLLQEWLLRSYRRLGRAEYLLIPLIVVVIAVHGVVAGVGLGMVAACMLFVIKYGRISAIRSEFDGRSFSSNVERAMADSAALRQHGGQVIGASLHRFLFFATANAILQRVRARLAEAERPRYVLLDFRRIDGLDASTSVSFLKLRQMCEAAGVTLVRSLSLAALHHMEAEDGDTAQQFHRFVVKVLAARLALANDAVRAAH
ncbi:cyclic nucleotide-binding protein [Duganella sp. sic0402]|uniref:SulP family inorganic anion transporter n=1 Tax=Duganella sp. sic0402 TaxID=2854786 RepID=UPI001C449916|nr:SulP family inorganic anion transporter [Duganella sp. sic0402]MBV7539022.1 cyclic nucleotide-binding protein [Duganella sp. sic0402]